MSTAPFRAPQPAAFLVIEAPDLDVALEMAKETQGDAEVRPLAE